MVSFLLFAVAMYGFELTAQTVKFKQVLMVDANTGTEYNGGSSTVFITFSNGQRSFQFTNSNGELINNTGNVYVGSWSYCNQYFSVVDYGGASISTPTGRHFNPRTFTYTGDRGDKKVYQCKRTVCDARNNRVVGYITDYIYFSKDMTHFSIYSGGDERSNGINDPHARSINLVVGNYIYVYESDNGSGKIY